MKNKDVINREMKEMLKRDLNSPASKTKGELSFDKDYKKLLERSEKVREMNASKTKVIGGTENDRILVAQAFKLGKEEGKLAFAKVSSNYSVGYKEGRASRIKEVLEIIDKCPDIPLPQHCSKKMLKAKLEKELGGTQ